jgi:hypothetical protein
MKQILSKHRNTFFILIPIVIFTLVYLYAPYKRGAENVKAEVKDLFPNGNVVKLPEATVPVTHIKTPAQVKSLYMTSWVGGTKTMRDRIIKLLDETEANAVVIDIKDATGLVAFPIDTEPFKSLGSTSSRIPDIVELIADLHSRGVYVIGRVATFQDPYLIKKWPEEAVKTETDKNALWRDRKGIGWFDAGSHKVWDYVIQIAKASYDVGFDEINFDYIRFPSDGDMKNIYFPYSEDKDKSEVLKSFFEYIDVNLRQVKNPIVVSADLFGMVTVNHDDLGIGQVLEKALPYFDFIDPMVYPSHFPDTWNGFANPAEHPYDVIKITMTNARQRAEAIGEDPKKLRPWLQDFNLGATYTKEMVRDQIQATYDSGLDSWLMWDPRNIFTRGALLGV